MSHRKFEQPRNGSLGFLPRKRTRKCRGKIRSFPKDDKTKAPHLTAFSGFKAGMTHITRAMKRPTSRLNKIDVVEAVTIIETPPMRGVGIVGYIETPRGLRALTTAWSNNLSKSFLRRYYKNWYASKNKKAFTKYVAEYNNESFQARINRIKKYCTIIRLIAHTQPEKVPNLKTKAGHIAEIQVNGGANAGEKVDFALQFLEKEVRINDVFQDGQVIDVLGATKGKGFTGANFRWGTKLLQKKTHRGYRKVGCIGSWHPANVQWTIARAGNLGMHHRTEVGKKIYRIGNYFISLTSFYRKGCQ